jgi:hypothetical protein
VVESLEALEFLQWMSLHHCRFVYCHRHPCLSVLDQLLGRPEYFHFYRDVQIGRGVDLNKFETVSKSCESKYDTILLE